MDPGLDFQSKRDAKKLKKEFMGASKWSGSGANDYAKRLRELAES